MKKRIIPCLFICFFIFFVGGCGKTSKETDLQEDNTIVVEDEDVSEEPETITERETETTTEKVSEMQEISLGDTITSDFIEFTLNKVELSYDVMPDNPPSFYSHYAADPGQVYIHVDADVKNIAKQNLSCDEIYTVTADYDNGYTYSGFSVVEETDGDFTYANITSIIPLQTLGIHNLVNCPQEIETSDKPLFIIITLNENTKLKYVIR